MRISDFTVGVLYEITTKDWEAPTGEVVPGKTSTREVLSLEVWNLSRPDAPKHQREYWQEYLCVRDPARDKVHLIHPRTIASAKALSPAL